jgi:hypothetical protein
LLRSPDDQKDIPSVSKKKTRLVHYPNTQGTPFFFPPPRSHSLQFKLSAVMQNQRAPLVPCKDASLNREKRGKKLLPRHVRLAQISSHFLHLRLFPILALSVLLLLPKPFSRTPPFDQTPIRGEVHRKHLLQ